MPPGAYKAEGGEVIFWPPKATPARNQQWTFRRRGGGDGDDNDEDNEIFGGGDDGGGAGLLLVCGATGLAVGFSDKSGGGSGLVMCRADSDRAVLWAWREKA